MLVRKTILINSEDWRYFKMQLAFEDKTVTSKMREVIKEYTKTIRELYEPDLKIKEKIETELEDMF